MAHLRVNRAAGNGLGNILFARVLGFIDF